MQAAIQMILENQQNSYTCLCLSPEIILQAHVPPGLSPKANATDKNLTTKEARHAIVSKHYKRMALLTHPDKNQSEESATLAFQLLRNAYGKLKQIVDDYG